MGDFQGNPCTVFGPGLEDDTHPSLANPTDDCVAADGFAGGVQHRFPPIVLSRSMQSASFAQNACASHRLTDVKHRLVRTRSRPVRRRYYAEIRSTSASTP